MAVGTLTDFKIYENQLYAGMIEQETQNFNIFNENSLGAILLENDFTKGNYSHYSFFKLIDDAVQRRDPTSVSSVTDKALTQGELIYTKLSRRYGPIAQTSDAFIKSGLSPETFSFVIGQQMSAQIQKDYMNTALAAARASLATVDTASLLHPASSTITTLDLVSGLALRGDAAEEVALWIMHSKVYYDLVREQINTATHGVALHNFVNGSPLSLNRNIYVTDSPSLVVAGTPDTYYTLGLAPGAVQIKTSEELKVTSELETAYENVFERIRADYAFNLGLAGMRWDTTKGVNPTNTVVSTGANWLQSATSTKSLGGVIISSE